MFELFYDVVKGFLLLTGSTLVLIGAIGLFRFPNIFTRMHACGVTDILGVLCISFALFLEYPTMPKILLINFFVWLGNPLVTHMIAKRAFKKSSLETRPDKQGKVYSDK